MKIFIKLLLTIILVQTINHAFSLGFGNTCENNGTSLRPIKLNGTLDFNRLEFGIRYMPTFSNIDIRSSSGGIIKGSLTANVGFGSMLAYNFTNHIGLQAEVDYFQLSQTFVDGNTSRKVELGYMNIPFFLSLNTDKSNRINWNFVAGPQLGVNVGTRITNTNANPSDSLLAVIDVKSGDLGFAYGTGLAIILNQRKTLQFDVGYRGYYGLIKMNGSNIKPNEYNIIIDASRKSHGAYIGLAFLFN